MTRMPARLPSAAAPEQWAATLAQIGEQTLSFSADAFDEILVLGTGVTLPLAPVLAEWISSRHAPPVRASSPGEIVLARGGPRPQRALRRLAVALSSAGEMPRALEALRQAGVVCLVLGAEGGDHAVALPDSPWGAFLAGQILFGTQADRAALALLPEAGRALVAAAQAIADLPGNLRRLLCLGSGPSLALAEAAARLAAPALAARALPVQEFRHLGHADAGLLVTLFAPPDRMHGLVLAQEIKASGATLVVIGPGGPAYRWAADLVLPAPSLLTDTQAALLGLLAAQMLAQRLVLAREPARPASRPA